MVTDHTKAAWLESTLRHKLVDSIKPQSEAFRAGVLDVVPPEIFELFEVSELAEVWCGSGIDDIQLLRCPPPPLSLPFLLPVSPSLSLSAQQPLSHTQTHGNVSSRHTARVSTIPDPPYPSPLSFSGGSRTRALTRPTSVRRWSRGSGRSSRR